jgi:hypothetical protein
MRGNDRRGNLRPRKEGRVFRLGNYIIVTDTKATEKNYFEALRDSIPISMRSSLNLQVVSNIKTQKLIDNCIEIVNSQPQYGILWIVFDRDLVPNFDEIIGQAEEQKINVGWSNPCIEVWFHAYFGKMPVYNTSKQCNLEFCKIFKNKTGQTYEKADKEIYKKLNKYGNEEEAIKIAEARYCCDKDEKPSGRVSVTTLHCLIEEIKSKIPKHKE